MKFYSDMPETTATGDKVLMVGDPTTPEIPKRITLAVLKAFIKSSFTFTDLTNRPSINNHELIEGNNTLESLGVQPQGNYVQEVLGQRMITEAEANKINNAIVDSSTLVLKDTKEVTVLEDVTNSNYIRVYDEQEGKEYKIKVTDLLSKIPPYYTTAKSLSGVKDGGNNVFGISSPYIRGSERVNINGSIYYPNIGFIYEGDNIVLTAAPVPESGDFILLEAIFI